LTFNTKEWTLSKAKEWTFQAKAKDLAQRPSEKCFSQTEGKI